ncbi:heme exporter protein CcmD [Caldimonas brevitalea]|uniref:Heme exporter protein D n=1 Tax=Caldimonas brevitalea TaxID=413882 RepID=A0A0G3BK25_9BURK|nr:heme exporter protein CcmD [Caldimonas brevitalea]AKJ28318.1 hypothetical protein AAW51_1627 [Caldimonas brevitalea]
MNIDWSLFWHMGGQGPYVWGAYGAALALVAAEAIGLWRRARRVRELRRETVEDRT